MRDFRLFFLFFIFVASGCRSVAGDSLRIALISDLHYFSPNLYDDGEARYSFEQSSGRHFVDQHKVFEHVCHEILKEKPDFLLLAGDLTHHGEKQSHIDFINHLEEFERQGICVLVIPGNHDVNISNAVAFEGGKRKPVPGITKEEFATLYGTYGYGEALYRDPATLSYVAKLNDTHWLLCIDSNRYEENKKGSISSGRIRPQTLKWALSLLNEAKEKGITVLGMMHHGIAEHMPLQAAFFPEYLVEDWEEHAQAFADAGMPLVFTGHFHANDIRRYDAPSGKSIYDIETASMAQYPFGWRMMTLQEGSLKVKSHFVRSIPDNTSLETDAYKRLEDLSRKVAKQQLKGLGYPIPEELSPLLTNLIVNLNMKHVRGDEKIDPEMMIAIRMFASFLGNEADIDNFVLDFPPSDNDVTLTWDVEQEELLQEEEPKEPL